jgi:hypothetical protein
MTPPSHDCGPEYPAFVKWTDGTPMALARESRWSRTYRHPTKNIEYQISRFDDGSASLKFDELSASWSQWTRAERLDFCYNCSWLRAQADFAEMLRFILREGDWQHLLELGAPPSDFEEAVRALSRHACKGNRDTCSGFLGGRYSWLPPPEPPKFGPG